MATFWDGATVLVTGGTGSFGQAFVDYALAELPVRTVRVFSRDEQKQAAMGARIRDDRLRLLLGDVRDLSRLRLAFQGVDVVIHAAALKRVDAIAHDPMETIKTNVLGAMNVVEAALDAGAKRVLGISTDKGCAPLNLYGATKLTMERLFTHANSYAGTRPTRFACVRYGNVLGSRGSVLELWRQQHERGDPIILTDPTATRFWLTLRKAVQFVVGAVEHMQDGEVFIPRLAHSRVVDLLIAYLGAGTPYSVSGMRPGGEKAHEDLISSHEGRWACYRNGHNDLAGWVLSPDQPGETLGEGYSIRSDQEPLATVGELRALLQLAGLMR